MEPDVPIDPLLKGAESLISAAPFVGTIIVALVGVIAYLFRENRAQRNQFDADIEAERERSAAELLKVREKHDIEIAAERRLNAELQNARLTELKAAFADVVKATGAVEQALALIHGGNR